LPMTQEMTQNAEDEARELLALMRRINPEDPMAAARAYPRVMAALRWFIENDDTNLGDPSNEYWEANYMRGKKVYKAASGGVELRKEDDDPDRIRFITY